MVAEPDPAAVLEGGGQPPLAVFKPQYIQMTIKIQQALIGEEVTVRARPVRRHSTRSTRETAREALPRRRAAQLEEAEKTAEEDWAEDARGGSSLDRRASPLRHAAPRLFACAEPQQCRRNEFPLTGSTQ